MNTTSDESIGDRYKRTIAEHRGHKSYDLSGQMLGAQADVGMQAEMEPAPETDLEALVNRAEMTIVGLSDLEGRLHHLFGKLTGGNLVGAAADTVKDKRGGLIGRGNDQQDRIDTIVLSCTGLVSRLSGLI